MAAHVLTALNQVNDDVAARGAGLSWAGLDAALRFSCWTEDLDLNEYSALAAIVQAENAQQLAAWVNSLLPQYKKKWMALGRPTTREAWLKQSYQA